MSPIGNNTTTWGRKTFCIITGSSRGIGKQMALRTATRVAPGSVILLMARDMKKLYETQQLIGIFNPSVLVLTVSVDLCDKETSDFFKILVNEFETHDLVPEEFDLAVMVHNAGSIYDPSKKTTEMENARSIREYFDSNFVSMVTLNTAFLKLFPNEPSMPERIIVNLSSKCGVVPIKTMGLYCTGKAARDMFFRVMAEEDPSLLILTYNPGHVDTDMTTDITDHIKDPDMKKVFSGRKEHGKLLSCDQTITCMLNILEKRNFKSGQHIRFDHE